VGCRYGEPWRNHDAATVEHVSPLAGAVRMDPSIPAGWPTEGTL